MTICYECGTVMLATPEERKLYNFVNDNPNFKKEFDIDYDLCHKCAELPEDPIKRHVKELELLDVGKKILNIKADKYKDINDQRQCSFCTKNCATFNDTGCKDFKISKKRLLAIMVLQPNYYGISRVLWEIFNRLKQRGFG